MTTGWLIHLVEWFFSIKGQAKLDKNPGQWYNNLLLRLIPWDLYSTCLYPLAQTVPHTALNSQTALSNSHGTLTPVCQGTMSYDCFWCDGPSWGRWWVSTQPGDKNCIICLPAWYTGIRVGQYNLTVNSRVVCETVYVDMLYIDLLRSITRAG